MLRAVPCFVVIACLLVVFQAIPPLGREQFVPSATAGNAPSEVSQIAFDVCPKIYTPPHQIDTMSKYTQSDPLKSQADFAVASQRRSQLRPIQVAIRTVGSLAAPSGDASKDALPQRCAINTLIKWAKSGSLETMTSKDAGLTRGRLMAEISITLVGLDRAGMLSDGDKAILNPWLGRIAADTVLFFQTKAGSVSKNNNHRYWAGLAVGAIGLLTGSEDDLNWAEKSVSIGLCQVDSAGHLPLELARGAQARNYHLYALRPLAATVALFTQDGRQIDPPCMSALRELARVTLAGLSNPGGFARMTGVAQADLPDETTYVPALRLGSSFLEL